MARKTTNTSAPSDKVQRYPLSWPAGWPRTPDADRMCARFAETREQGFQKELSIRTAIVRLRAELRRLGAVKDILSTNVLLSENGAPGFDQREPRDRGAAVYFELYGHPRVLACDHWTRVADNIAAIAAHIGAMRAVDRYAVGTLDQAFTGYAALPAPAPKEWWGVLGLSPTATLDEVEVAFRQLARNSHPDVGGSHEGMARLTAARAEAREALARLSGRAR
jgi:hypothetical protein